LGAFLAGKYCLWPQPRFTLFFYFFVALQFPENIDIIMMVNFNNNKEFSYQIRTNQLMILKKEC
jgi:hypothetical protein